MGKHIGLHCTWDIYGGDSTKLSYVPFISKVLHNTIDNLNLKKIEASFKQFDPIGVTGFILLEESHISIHTWPEHEFAAVDVFSCNDFDVDLVTDYLLDLLDADRVETNVIKRGVLPKKATLSFNEESET